MFSLFMNEITKIIQSEVPWCVLFADGIVLVEKILNEVDNRLEEWSNYLESNGLKISRSKSVYTKTF